RLAGPIAELRAWDDRWSAASVATSLAVFWGETVLASARPRRGAGLTLYDYFDGATAAERLAALAAAADHLTRDFGSWRTPWGEINRVQRLTDEDGQPFSDSASSMPVPFTSARWGSLASLEARTYSGTKRRYGTYGNTFVAVVEFGRDSVRAMA